MPDDSKQFYCDLPAQTPATNNGWQSEQFPLGITCEQLQLLPEPGPVLYSHLYMRGIPDEDNELCQPNCCGAKMRHMCLAEAIDSGANCNCRHQDSGLRIQNWGLRTRNPGYNNETIYQENENLLSVNERKLSPWLGSFQLSPVGSVRWQSRCFFVGQKATIRSASSYLVEKGKKTAAIAVVYRP